MTLMDRVRGTSSADTLQEDRHMLQPSIEKQAANPNDAMNHGCHKLKLLPPIRAQVTKVA